jgi:hypothetical protein
MAEILIEEQHDIAETHYDIAFPWLCCLWGFIRRCRESDEESSGEKKKDAKQSLIEGLKN